MAQQDDSVYAGYDTATIARTVCGVCGAKVWNEDDQGGVVIALPCTNPKCPRYRKPPQGAQ